MSMIITIRIERTELDPQWLKKLLAMTCENLGYGVRVVSVEDDRDRKENEMRVILFRGKRIDDGEWVYGQYAYLLNARTKDGKPIKHMIVDGTPFGQTVDPSTVGQYTGLTDKNGKKIFEGDIVEGFDFCADDDGYGVVTWDDGGFLVSNAFLCGSFVENYNGRDFEVIGNIHDNPELMEGE